MTKISVVLFTLLFIIQSYALQHEAETPQFILQDELLLFLKNNPEQLYEVVEILQLLVQSPSQKHNYWQEVSEESLLGAVQVQKNIDIILEKTIKLLSKWQFGEHQEWIYDSEPDKWSEITDESKVSIFENFCPPKSFTTGTSHKFVYIGKPPVSWVVGTIKWFEI